MRNGENKRKNKGEKRILNIAGWQEDEMPFG